MPTPKSPLRNHIVELTKVLDRWPNQPPSDIDMFNLMRTLRDALIQVESEFEGAYETFKKIVSTSAILGLMPDAEKDDEPKHHGYV